MNTASLTSEANHPEAGRPWYRYFFPWFLLALLAMAVIGSSTAAWWALNTRDTVLEHADSAE